MDRPNRITNRNIGTQVVTGIFSGEAEEVAEPPVLRDGDQRAVRGGDGQQVHQGRLHRDRDRPEHDHQQQHGQRHDHADQPGQALAVGEGSAAATISGASKPGPKPWAIVA